MDTTENKYFASMNTACGFKNYFSSIFDPSKFSRIFILKGGPGTGKSSLMKQIADEEEQKGKEVERFVCSADPNSLDGVILKESKIAILDGTAPHTTDPKYPGIVENIINLGSFWDTKKMLPYKSEIMDLLRQKKRHFQRAYQFLSASGEIASEIQNFSKKFINEEKMLQSIKVQASHFFMKNNSGEETVCRNISTICKNGILKLNSFENSSKRVWVVEDHYRLASIYLEKLKTYSMEQNQKIYVSYSPLFPNLPNGIFYPKSKTCFVIGERNYEAETKEKEYHYVNMKRFLNLEKLSEGKQKIKFGEKCLSSLFLGATEALTDAANAHEALEKYYIASMNYSKMESVKEEIRLCVEENEVK